MTAVQNAETGETDTEAARTAEPDAAVALAVFRATALVVVMLLVGFGGLMWALRGEAVFTDLVSTVLAWCM